MLPEHALGPSDHRSVRRTNHRPRRRAQHPKQPPSPQAYPELPHLCRSRWPPTSCRARDGNSGCEHPVEREGYDERPNHQDEPDEQVRTLELTMWFLPLRARQRGLYCSHAITLSLNVLALPCDPPLENSKDQEQ